ncbi:DUF2892 family protein [Halopolyspora algeriensis]|uniref:DUF2892 family protein n=1 Tax=Halopolyspora algeriensis TaxID=1500506 RepID=A0A368VRX8_9ACTN|nr:YgaP-like transmembrane domain [Halopolyspora algeriensis]RCW44459.1 DUF2892 family protein [Halopolyspora algeriensis]TQM55820.1 DUF2892 family protein [Halopolyspora algeriensis]
MPQREMDRGRTHSSKDVTRHLDQQRLERIARCVDAPSAEVTHHVTDLDRSWDIERTLEANAATISLVSVALATTHSRRWLILAAVVPAFLLQHAVQGWCPPIAVFRRWGSRTRHEIDAERTAIKALRGDFVDMASDTGDATASAQRALDAAGKR